MKLEKIQISAALLSKGDAELRKLSERSRAWSIHSDDEAVVEVDASTLSNKTLTDIATLAKEENDQRTRNLANAIVAMREGKHTRKVPNYKVFPTMFGEYMKQHWIRGWLFMDTDGKMRPYLAVSCDVHEPRGRDDGPPIVSINMKFLRRGESSSGSFRNRSVGGQGIEESVRRVRLEPSDIAHKTIPEILENEGVVLETDDLLDDYDEGIRRFREVVLPTFSKQMMLTRAVLATDDEDPAMVGARKVINDTRPEVYDRVGLKEVGDSEYGDEDNQLIPLHTSVRVFDLKSHQFSSASGDDLEPYEFDPTLREKLVLPPSHRDLLDVLTADLSVFSNDIIRGKSAGNIIICKGRPGLGKTLTCEVYSELTETPVYSVHSGTLGTTPESVKSELDKILKRQARWGCIVLLDEADVFVRERGDDIAQNAIVAEFLRVLEYCDGLIFMTTNREDDMDEAIISRAAAIISYDMPDEHQRKHLWEVMLEQNDVKPTKKLVDDLVHLFPEINGRDIKMLLRLALRVHTAMGDKLDADLFRRCAMFRNVKIAQEG